MSDNIREFEQFNEEFKHYEESVPYNAMDTFSIKFDSEKELTPISLIDPEDIIKQVSEISKKQFYYNSVYESQKRVLQTVQDEFELWYAQKYVELDTETEKVEDRKTGEIHDSPIKRSKTQIEVLIKSRFKDEYLNYLNIIKHEKYKLGLVSGVRESLRSFSYKLNNINEYARKMED